MTEPRIIDADDTIVEGVGELAIKHEQFIPQSFMDDIKREKLDSLSTPAGELYRVARIPVAVMDEWHRQGFDYNRAPVQEILRKLRIDQLDGFITTNKRI